MADDGRGDSTGDIKGYMVSPRYHNRLSFQTLEANSIVKNMSINRRSTYGMNWALKAPLNDLLASSTPMVSPRLTNRLDRVEKTIKRDVAKRNVEKIVARDAMRTTTTEYSELEGVARRAHADRWSEDCPDDWTKRDVNGPAASAINSLPTSVALINNIERWLIQHDSNDADASSSSPEPELTSPKPVDDDHNQRQTLSGGTKTVRLSTPFQSMMKIVPKFCHRLLTSPLLYTPAGFGRLARPTMTLPRPRPRRHHAERRADPPAATRPTPAPISDIVVQPGRREQRRRTRQPRQRRPDDVEPVRRRTRQPRPPLLDDVEPVRRRSLESGTTEKRSSTAPADRRRRRLPYARIKNNMLEFVIDVDEEDDDGKAVGSSPILDRSFPKLTAVERHRRDALHRKKLRDDSESFVAELERQLDPNEIKLGLTNPTKTAPCSKHFMSQSQSTRMKGLGGEALRFLYLEGERKARDHHVDQRQTKRDVSQARSRIEQIRQRERQYCRLREQKYVVSVREVNVEVALAGAKERLRRYQQQLARTLSNSSDPSSIGHIDG